MRILILEDDAYRHKQFRKNYGISAIITTTAKDCIWALNSTPTKFDLLFLDHDLGGSIMQDSGPGTGYEVACWLEQHPEYCPEYIVIHSFNPDGASRMQAALPNAVRFPNAWSISLDDMMEYLKG